MQARRRFSRSSHAGSVRLGAFTSFDSPVLAVALREFNRLHPDIRVTIYLNRSDVLLSRLRDGTLDIVIAVRQQGHGFGPPVWQDELVWVGNREIPARRREPIPLAALAEPSMLRRIAVDALNGAGIPHSVAFESNSFMSVASAIDAGMAVGVFTAKLRPLYIPIIHQRNLLPPLGAIDFILLKSTRDQRKETNSLLDILRSLSPSLFETAAPVMFGHVSQDSLMGSTKSGSILTLPSDSNP